MRIFILLIIINFSIFSEFAHGDVLIIDRINKAQDFTIPPRGINMNQVISKFGEPLQKKAAIGEPPITTWEYDKFSVYFERQWVITTVVHKASELEKGPKYINK
ncbi:MAG: hypothetical protein L3J53_02165 [Proteobacteria bacterium]|nr:hypothetical protein [Pseudomonadota bacterium]